MPSRKASSSILIFWHLSCTYQTATPPTQHTAPLQQRIAARSFIKVRGLVELARATAHRPQPQEWCEGPPAWCLLRRTHGRPGHTTPQRCGGKSKIVLVVSQTVIAHRLWRRGRCGALSISLCLLLMRMLCLPALRASCTQGMVMGNAWDGMRSRGKGTDRLFRHQHQQCHPTVLHSIPCCSPFKGDYDTAFHEPQMRAHFDGASSASMHARSLFAFFSDGGTACVSPRPSLSYPACCRRPWFKCNLADCW